jgi:hypothetical protein
MRWTPIAVISGFLLGFASLAARADESILPPPDEDGRAHGNCQIVNAHIVSTFFVDGCTSPVGICTQGNIASGPLAGTTLFTVLTADSPPDFPDVLHYTGQFAITTENGTLTIQDSGVFDQANGVFFERDPIASGTGIFANATGPLFSFGTQTANPPGFDGFVVGLLCGVGQAPGLPEDT